MGYLLVAQFRPTGKFLSLGIPDDSMLWQNYADDHRSVCHFISAIQKPYWIAPVRF
jgi:hypothetical protein